MKTIVALIFAIAVTASAATRTWTGGGTNNNWTTAANWGGTAPVAGDSLVFPTGAARKTNNNDFAADTAFGSITIQDSGYAVSGNRVALSGGVSTDYANGSDNSFGSLPILLTANSTFTGTSGWVTLGAVDMGAFTLQINNGAGSRMGISSLTGSQTVTKTGAGEFNLGSNPAFTGAITASAGTIGAEASDSFGTTAGATTLTNTQLSLGGANIVIPEIITFSGSSGIIGVGVNPSFSGTVIVNTASEMVVQSSAGNTVTFSGSVQGTSGLSFLCPAVLSGSTSNTLAGTVRISNTLTLSKTGGAVAAPGGLFVNIPAGAVTCTGANQIEGDVTLKSGTTLNLSGNSDTIGALSLDNGSSVQTGGGILTIAGTVASTGTASISGNIAVSGTRAWSVNLAADLLNVSANISGVSSPLMQRMGSGKLVLTGTNSLAAVRLDAGTTLFNGSNSAVVTLNGGTIGGTGSVAVINANAPGGTVAPGASPGILGTGTLSWNSNTTFNVEIDGTSSFDKITCDGDQTIAGNLNVTLGSGFSAAVGSVWRIIENAQDNPGGISGTFTGKANNSTFAVGNYTFRINYNVGESNDDVELTLVSIAPTGTTKTWSGAGGNALWSNGANWVGGVAPVQGDNLQFPNGAAQLTNTNDFVTDITLAGITMSAAYNLGGNRVVLINGINGASATLCTVSLPVKLGGNQTFTSSTGELRLGTIDLQSNTLTLDALTGTSIQGNSVISGTGGLVKQGVGTVSLNDANTFSGTVVANAGTLKITHPSALGTGSTTTVNSGCILSLDSGGVAMTVSENIVVNSGAIHSTGDDHELAGTISVTGTASIVVHDSNFRIDGSVSGTGGLSFSAGTPGGSASIRGTSANTNGGGITTSIPLFLNKSAGVAAVSSGLFVNGTIAQWSQADQVVGAVTVSGGGTINLNGLNDSITALTLSQGNVTTATGTLTLAGNLNASGSSTISGKLAVSGARTWTTASAGDVLTISAPITGTGASVTYAGAGQLVLSGSTSLIPSMQLNSGTTLMNGTASTAFILNGGTLGGTGAFGNITSSIGGGVVAPGAGPQFFPGSMSLNAATTVQIDVAGTTAMTQYDQINCDGTQNLNGAALQINVTPGTILPVGTVLRIINDNEDAAGNIVGTFAGKPENSTFNAGGHTFRINYNTGNVDDVDLTVVSYASTGVTKTWTGLGANALWSTGTNWSGGVAPVMGDALAFPAGASQLTNTNDFAAGTFFHAITVQAAYFLSGNAVTVTAMNATLSTGTAFVSCNTAFTPGTQSFTISSGNLTIIGTILASNGTLTVDTSSGAVLQLTGVISGNSAISKINSGILSLTGNNDFTGELTLNDGQLSLSNSGALGSVAGGTHLLNGSCTLNGALTIPDPIELHTASSILFSGNSTLSGPLTTSGTVGLTCTLQAGGGVQATLSGAISGPRGITLTGAGTFVISGTSANTFSDRLSVNVSTVTLAKTAGVDAIPAGTLLLGENNRIISLGASNQIAGGVRLTAGAALNLNGNNEALNALDMEGGTTVNTGAGTLTLAGTLHAYNAASTINGKLEMAGACTLTVDDSSSLDDLTINAVISGSALPNLTRNGAGRIVLTAANTLTAMRLDAGDTAINGTNSALALTLNGGKLSGTGSVASITSAASGGTIAPGGSPGLFNAGALSLNAATTVQLELNGLTAGSNHDQLVTSTATNDLGGAMLQFTLGFSPVIGNSFKLLRNTSTTGATTGTFAGLPEGAAFVFGPHVFRINYNAGTNGNDTVLTCVTQPPPTLISSSITDGPGAGIKTVQMSGTCAFGATAVFQESFNLVNWSSIDNVTADTTGHWSFNLNRPAAVPQMFFRVLIP